MTDFIEPNLPGLYATANGKLYLKGVGRENKD